MRVDIYVYGALLAAGLGTAYWASLPVADGSDEKVSVLSLDPKAVTEVDYKTSDVELVAVKRPSDGRFWVTFTKSEMPPDNPHQPKDPKAPPPVAKVTTERFLANEKMDDLLKSLNPLLTDRILDQVGEKQLADYGLKDSKDSWTVKSGAGKDFVLILGKRSYGSRSRFAQQPDAKNRVLIIDGDDLENLERGSRSLFERRLTNVEFAEVTKASVAAGDKTKALAHTSRDQDGQLLWTEDTEGAKPKPTLDAFMDKVGKMRLTEYASPEDEATAKALTPFLTVTLNKGGNEVEHLQFKKTAGDKPVYWVTSDYLQVHGKLANNRMEPLEKDIPALLSDKAEAAPPAAKSK